MCRAYTRDEEVSILNQCDKLGYLDLKDFVICLIDTGASPEDLRTGNSKNLIRNLDGSINVNKSTGSNSDLLRKIIYQETKKNLYLSKE